MSTPTAILESTAESIQLNDNDVIVKPDTSDDQHPGNISFQRIINLNKGKYKAAADKTERLRIAKTIVQSIHKSKARFVERNNRYAGEWREVDMSVAIKAVIFALRGVQPNPVKAQVIDVTVKEEDVPVTASEPKSTVSAEQELPIEQPKISTSQLLELKQDQINSFSMFPVGCRVQYNINRQAVPTPANAKYVTSLRVGTVKNVFMDLSSKGFVYEITPSRTSGDSAEFLTEAQLTYGPGTSVTVKLSDERNGYEGEILQYKVGSQSKLYSVMLFRDGDDAQIFDDVSVKNIRFRQVEKESDIQVDSAAADGNKDDKKDSDPNVQGEDSKNQSNSSSLLDEAVSPSSKTSSITPPADTVTTSSNKRPASPTISSLTQEDAGSKENSPSDRPTKLQKGSDTPPQASQKTSQQTSPRERSTSNSKSNAQAKMQHNTPVGLRTELSNSRYSKPSYDKQNANEPSPRERLSVLSPPTPIPMPNVSSSSGA